MQTTQAGALSDALERWNAGDLDGYLELYDERIRLHGYSPEPMTKTAVRAFYRQIFKAFGTPALEFHETGRHARPARPDRSGSRTRIIRPWRDTSS